MEAALSHLRQQHVEFNEEDIARLSLLSHKHVNMLGQYSFLLDETIGQGELRPLNMKEIEDEDA